MPRTVVTLTNNRLPELARRLPRAVAEIVETSAKAIETDVKVGMAAAKSGRVYDVGGVAPHQASAPGEMPAVDTGALINSIQTEMEGPTMAVVYTNQEYAIHLEYGAPAAGIAPRPFFIPAAERERPHFQRAMADLEQRL